MIQGQVDALRQAIIPLELRAPNGQTAQVAAVIDTGFDGFVTLAPDHAERFQLPFLEVHSYALGDGNAVDFAIHLVTVVWDGQEREVEALGHGRWHARRHGSVIRLPSVHRRRRGR